MLRARPLAHVLAGLAVVLPAVLFTTTTADPVNLVKMATLVLCAIGLLALGLARVVAARQARLPWGVPAVVAAGLLLAVIVAAVRSPVTTTAVLGSYGRNSGLLAYASALVVFAAVLVACDRRSTRVVLYALMVAGAFTASYGLLQYAGLDPLSWSSENPVIAALGNSNFAAAYLGICVPAFMWAALSRRVAPRWRLLAAAGALACLLVAVLTQAAQGPLAAVAGGTVVVAGSLLDAAPRLRRRGLAAITLLVTGGLVMLGWGAAGGGPAASVFAETSSRARGWFWETAYRVWLQEPLLGVGLENFAPYWLRERSVAAVQGLGGEDVTNAAHSVPLHFLATGGVVLFGAYVVFVGMTAWALVRGLRRLRGDERLLLAALGGCWTAYQVQSLVSIDQVPLLVAHYALAGAIVVSSGTGRVRVVRLPGATAPASSAKAGPRGRGPATRQRERTLQHADHAMLAAVVATALALSWLTLVPLRADAAARAGDVAVSRGEGTPGLVHYRRATQLLPGESRYWQRLGDLLLKAEQPEQALEAFRRGMQADPFDPRVVRGAARAAEQAGQLRTAELYHRKALELHPWSPSAVVAAANFQLAQGRPESAKALLVDALEVLPLDATLWAALGELHLAVGEVDEARYALGRAVALDPRLTAPAERLRSLDQQPA